MQMTTLRQRLPLLLALMATACPIAAWSADGTAKSTVTTAASAPKAQVAKKQSASDECPQGSGEKTGSTGPSTKGETGTQGGGVVGPKKPKCPQDIAPKVSKQQ